MPFLGKLQSIAGIFNVFPIPICFSVVQYKYYFHILHCLETRTVEALLNEALISVFVV